MKLHWSPKSPFVRKVMIVAHEAGLLERLALVRSVAIMSQPNPVLMQDNPVSRIPALVLEDGTVLTDSFLICSYLDTLNQGPKLIPPEGPERWKMYALHGVANGILDVLVLWRNERNRPAERRSQPHLAAFETKARASLDRLEAQASSLERPYDLGHIALGCALEYVDFRFPDLNWRATRPQLASWAEVFSARPSSIATAIVDD